MEGIAKVLDVIAWPITTIVIVLLLKAPIASLAPMLRRFKYKELEVEFERSLDEISKRSSEEIKTLPHPPTEDSNGADFLDQVQALPPRATILETWLELEHTAYFIAQKFKLMDLNRRTRFHDLLRILQQRDILLERDIEDINKLKSLRNAVVHERDIDLSREEAEKYSRVAMQVADVLVARAFDLYGNQLK